jgi:hypothetical protein
VLLLSDGGKSPWNICNSHLLEIPLKEKHATNKEEKEYLLKCVNPDNPFSEEINEEVTYSKEHGCLIQEEIEVPRTIFHWVKRSNRTCSSAEMKRKAESVREHGEAISIINLTDPTTHLDHPNNNIPINRHLIGVLETHSSDIDMTEEKRDGLVGSHRLKGRYTSSKNYKCRVV